MKRYIVVFLLLVVLDQLFGWAANTAFVNGQEMGLAFLRIGRWDHAAPIIGFLPTVVALIAALAMAAIFRVQAGDDFYKLFGLPITMIASATTTQVIDMLGRGYAVNYVGIQDMGWVVKITDTAYELAVWLVVALVVAGLIKSVLRGVTHDSKQAASRI